MIKNRIDVSSALRQSVSQTYSHLVTRSTGAAVRAFIEKALAQEIAEEVERLGVAVIDFTHVGMMDFSCADEIVAKLILNNDEGMERFVFSGLSESHIEAIDAVLERHGLALVTKEADSCMYVAPVMH